MASAIGLEKSERFLKICILAKKQNLETLFEYRKEKNLAARHRDVSFIEFERVFEDFSTSVAELFRVDLRLGVKLRQFRNSFCSANRSKKFFAD